MRVFARVCHKPTAAAPQKVLGKKQQEMKSEALLPLKYRSAQTLRGASRANQQNQPAINNVLKAFIQGIMFLNALTVQWGYGSARLLAKNNKYIINSSGESNFPSEVKTLIWIIMGLLFFVVLRSEVHSVQGCLAPSLQWLQ